MTWWNDTAANRPGAVDVGAVPLAQRPYPPALGPVGGVPLAPPAASRRALRGAIRGASPLALAAITANIANLIVTLLLARQLSTASYGTLAQLLALFFVVSMPGSALLVGVVRTVTPWQQAGETVLIDQWVARVRRAGVALVALTAMTSLLLRGVIATALSLPNPRGVAEILTAGAAWCLLCVDRGLLQSTRAYAGLAANLVLEGLVRGALAVGLVLAGLGVGGVCLAILLSVLVGLGHGRTVIATRSGRHQAYIDLPAARAARPVHPGGYPVPGPAPNRLAVEIGTALIALVLLGVLQNIDVLVIGAYRSAETGSYAAVSVACKVLVFAAVVLGGFLLPETAARRHHGHHALHQLGATLAMLAVPAAGLLLVAVAAPAQGLSLAFGPRLTACASAFAPLAGAMTCLGATVLCTHYLLAVGARGVLVMLAAAAALAIAGIWWMGGAAVATARLELALYAVLAAGTGLLVWSSARRAAVR
ncbi:hypothetical protein [Frankia sp. Cj3]|uniref:hypothetical protein n=1 Tax=Frankia sp. Cj3 TaxID=2880976 RepID=UPI001EF49D70|nr:hypothetical protein [Frankia sp. Cj3]